jgi:hypothetical protein
MCTNCPYDCLTCNSLGFCLTCDLGTDHRAFNNATYRCMPISGYYDIGVAASINCALECATCSAVRLCLTCNAGYFMREDKYCYSDCLSRFYPDNSSLVCRACPYDCLTCDFTGLCLSCDSTTDHRGLNYTTYRCLALAGYYDNNATVCPQCPSACSICSSASNCAACTQSFFLRKDSFCYSNCL